ncbi:MAG TPA: hypothetical protein VK790_04310 [Solirubrobacteraceae bacterium]|jgi:peroxiredoxin|nr:hypothetical protein [Solirubrobacteraceae bacterium]
MLRSEHARAAMTAGGSHEMGISDRLVGVAIPRVILCDAVGRPVGLHESRSVVIYTYPGCRSSPGDGEQTAIMDNAQHRAFRQHQQALEARRYIPIGISSQPRIGQQRALVVNRLSHTLLSDPGFELADALGLPTFTREGERFYQRLVLIASGGVIRKVFFPVSNALRSPAQALAWLTMQGAVRDVDNDDAG